MELDEKIAKIYHLFFGDNGEDYDTSKKLDKILQYAIEREAKASNILKVSHSQDETIEILIEENQRLQQKLDAERAASTAYSQNLWNVLESLGKREATVQFTLMN